MSTNDERQRLAARFDANAPLRALILTLSDRAYAGEYGDEGGDRIEAAIRDFFEDCGVTFQPERAVLPDEAALLREKLTAAADDGVEVVFTTGGTGVGLRDVTPDVVLELARKTIPGIMDHIRLKYGAMIPAALLSRSVAAVIGDRTLVYTLPGSPRAVDQYLSEILDTIEHLLCVLHGIEAHA